jgi:CheY-like chemotaxis protein
VNTQTATTPNRIVTGYSGPRKMVLVVDDEAENRTVVGHILRPLGFEVAEAVNGREGLEMAQRLRPHLILMDIAMPEMDGLEAVRRLRQLAAFKDMPVIAASASVSVSDSKKSLEAGMSAFLSKPLDVDKLLEQMGTLLQLDWIYDSQAPSSSERETMGLLVAPPADEMETLHDLARMGNMQRIVEYANYLVQLDERYRPFANQLRSLAKNYESKALLNLVERYLHSDSLFNRQE